jgi:type IV pilus assembly protein PilB
LREKTVVPKKIGESFIQAGLITPEELHAALAEQTRTGERIGAVLVRLHLATEKQVTKALAYQADLRYVSLTEDPPERAAIVLIPRHVALDRVAVGVRLHNDALVVAAADPMSPDLVKDLALLTGRAITQVMATRSDILESIASGYPASVASTGGTDPGVISPVADVPVDVVDPRSASLEVRDNAQMDIASDAAAVDDLLALVVNRAVATGATDVHIDPRERGVVVRHRIDGVLTGALDLPQWAHERLLARVKELGGLDASETRWPQQGLVCVRVEERDVEFRAFTVGTLFGERIVLRLLGRRKTPPPLEELGFSAGAMEAVRGLLRHPHGLIVVAGPGVSGRTTTLASAAAALDSDVTTIVSLEERMEYLIRGANQTRAPHLAERTTAAMLEAILEQDPDIVVIGDMREPDVAKVAMHAAQKRQLVLASVHADSAPAAAARLGSLVPDSSVAGSVLVGVIAQRLVRRLCVACRRQYTPDADTLRTLGIAESSAAEMIFYHAVGCDECHQTGYRGRIAIYEVMRASDTVRRLIAQRAGEDRLQEAAIQSGMVPLGDDGLGKVKAGITTADELLRVVTEIRRARPACPECSGAIGVDFKVCPRCGHRVNAGCLKCGRTLQPDWEFCPYCATITRKRKKKVKDHKTLDLPTSNVAEFKNQNRS